VRILFFDSRYELDRAKLLGGLVAIRKRGGSGLVRQSNRADRWQQHHDLAQLPFESRGLPQRWLAPS
jgi:hypothetical protein